MRSLPRGVYTAIPTFFTETEELDMEAFEKHVECKYHDTLSLVPVLILDRCRKRRDYTCAYRYYGGSLSFGVYIYIQVYPSA